MHGEYNMQPSVFCTSEADTFTVPAYGSKAAEWVVTSFPVTFRLCVPGQLPQPPASGAGRVPSVATCGLHSPPDGAVLRQ